METKGKKQHGREIQFSSINPLELWRKLGLLQASEKDSSVGESSIMPSQLLGEEEGISDEESMRAFDVFRSDFSSLISDEMEVPIPELVISEDKGGLFIWALLKEIGKRSTKNKKLSSISFVLKDAMCATLAKKAGKLNIQFEEEDFDVIAEFLQKKNLIRTSEDGIRITRKFTQLFHEAYRAWLVF